MLTPQRPPPEDYYQNNCATLFRHVLACDGALLGESQRQSLGRFLQASDDAQRLFARLLTRKGPIVRVDSLQYPEVGNLVAAIDELVALQLLTHNAPVAADVLLDKLRKAELLELAQDMVSAKQQGGSAFKRSLRKPELVASLLSGRADRALQLAVSRRIDWVALAVPGTWARAQFLYFGGMSQDWSTFIMRDLGMVDYEQPNLNSRLFTDVHEFGEALHFVHLASLAQRVDEHPNLLVELMQALSEVPPHRYARRRRDRALLALGRWCERQEFLDAALTAYALVQRHPARERQVRILHKISPEQLSPQELNSGKPNSVKAAREQAQLLLQEMRDAPFCDEEVQFTERFGRRRGGFQPQTRTIGISHARQDIEVQALEILLDGGVEGCTPLWGSHVENNLVRTLTGLLYWPIIFADVPGAFTNPFQASPNDLFEDDFCLTRKPMIDGLEDLLEEDEALTAHLYSVVSNKRGLANRLVNWSLLDAISMEDLLEAIPLAHIRSLCAFLIRNLASRRSGLPDLLVAYGPQRYELIEVKGPNDQLQPGQRVWFSHFARLGIPASVLKLTLQPAHPTEGAVE